MQLGTFSHALCVGMLAMYCQASVADETSTAPPASKPVSVKRACAEEKGATKKECDKVAAQIDAETANPDARPATDDAQSRADYVHHSSPAMRTPAEVAQDKAKARTERKLESSKPAPK